MTAIARSLVALSKPRVVVLLVFTGVCGVYAAAGGSPSWEAVVGVIVAGWMSASGANAINQGFDADIDAVMVRTRRRPVPTHQFGPRFAMTFGVALVVAACLLMWLLTNWMAAALMFAAAATYVLVYTVALKRRSWNNIVIGGAAGAFPPLIGSAAVTGSIDALGLYMFAIVFFWTLSILLKEDYAAANVPMLAAVASPRATAMQISLYIVLLGAMAWLPLVAGYAGWTFAIATTLLSLDWLRRTRPLFDAPTHRETLSAYKYSLLYLALAFLVLAIEPVLPWS